MAIVNVPCAEVENNIHSKPDISKDFEGFETLRRVPPVDPNVKWNSPAQIEDQ